MCFFKGSALNNPPKDYVLSKPIYWVSKGRALYKSWESV